MSRFTQIAELQRLRQDVDMLIQHNQMGAKAVHNFGVELMKLQAEVAELRMAMKLIEPKRVGRPKKDE